MTQDPKKKKPEDKSSRPPQTDLQKKGRPAPDKAEGDRETVEEDED